MSRLAQVFVIFNLLLSLVFFGTSATLFKTRVNWRSEHEKYKAKSVDEIKNLGVKLGELTDQLDRQKRDVDRYKLSEDALAKDKKQLQSDVNSEKARVTEANSAREKAEVLSQQSAKTLESEIQRNQSLSQVNEQLKTNLDKTLSYLDAANRKGDSLTLDLATLQGDLRKSTEEYTKLSEHVEELEVQLAYFTERYPGEPPGRGPLAPRIDGFVSAVDKDEPLVVLSVGKNANVENGYRFTVARGEEFVGKVQVIKVYPTLSGARILFTKEGEQIQRGDKAYITNE